jgi:hypothetical protein
MHLDTLETIFECLDILVIDGFGSCRVDTFACGFDTVGAWDLTIALDFLMPTTDTGYGDADSFWGGVFFG